MEDVGHEILPSGFYSPVEKAVAESPRAAGNKQAWLNTIRKSEGVTDELLGEHKLDDVLGAQPIDKAALLAHVRATKPVVEHVVHHDIHPDIEIRPTRRGDFADESEDMLRNYPEGHTVLRKGKPEQFTLTQASAQKYAEGTGSAKFGSHRGKKWQTPGGTNYREHLLTLKPPEQDLDRLEKQIKDIYAQRRTLRNGDPRIDKLQAEEDRLINLRSEARASHQEPYQSAHFDEPNILAHIRTQDFNQDGKKTLLLDEIQSDWHQAGRDRGYKSGAAKKALEEYVAGLRDRYIRNGVEINTKRGMPPERALHEARQTEEGQPHEAMARYLGEGDTHAKLYNAAMEEFDREQKGVPDAPFKNTWHQLAIKKALQIAAKEGYDRVALTTGDTQNKRFSLSNVVSKLEYMPKRQGGGQVVGYDADGTEVVSHHVAEPSDVHALVGKDVGERLLKHKSVEGKDLEVGGAGMKKWYDEILPGVLDKIGRRYGARVGRSTLPGSSTPIWVARDRHGKELSRSEHEHDLRALMAHGQSSLHPWEGATVRQEHIPQPGPEVHHLDITPELRRAVLGGVGYAEGGKVEESPQFKNWFGDWQDPKAFSSRRTGAPVSHAMAQGRPRKLYHHTTADFDTFDPSREGTNSGTFGSWKTKRHGMFFAETPQHAEAHHAPDTPGANTMPVYLSMKAPLDLTHGVGEGVAEELAKTGHVTERFVHQHVPHWSMFDDENGKAFTDAVRAAGYDSVRFNDENPETGDSAVTHVAFEPHQIKSAIGNSTFDPNDPRIHMAKGGSVEQARDKWLEGSVVKDRLYTGTSKDVDFNKFKVPRNGAWFTSDPEGASSYAMQNDSMNLEYDGRNFIHTNTASRVMPVHVRITNPAHYPDQKSMIGHAENYKRAQGQLFDQLRAAGHDGVIIGGHTYVVIGKPHQIKSAIGNSTFDPNDPRIHMAKGGRVDQARDKWLEGSAVKDRLYHGTTRDFDTFKHHPKDIGMHFGTVEQANDRAPVKAGEAPQIMPVHVRITNPLRLTDHGDWHGDNTRLNGELRRLFPDAKQDIRRLASSAAVRNFIKSRGHDGIVYLNRGEGLGQSPNEDAVSAARTDEEFRRAAPAARDSYIAFEPHQIKSAIGNSTFDPNDPRIHMAKGGRVEHPMIDVDGTPRHRHNANGQPIHPTDEGIRNFHRWFGQSKTVDEHGRPLVMYHGTTHPDIKAFDTTRGNPESALGAGAYTTSSREDASTNYAGEGPDLTGRIENRADQIAYDMQDDPELMAHLLHQHTGKHVPEDQLDSVHHDKIYAAAKHAAKQELKGKSEGLVMPLYVKAHHPFEVRAKSPYLEINEEHDEHGDPIAGTAHGSGLDLANALHHAAREYGGDPDDAAGPIWDNAGDISHGDLFNQMGNRGAGLWYHPHSGETVSHGHVLQQALRDTGKYDAMLQDAHQYFGPRRGPVGNRVLGMAGLHPGTLHVLPFHPHQIKSALGNQGTFDPNEPDITKKNGGLIHARKRHGR